LWLASAPGYHPRALATDELGALEIRVGTIVGAEALRGARKPAYALSIDFGDLGRRASSAEIADLYDAQELVGLQVVAVVNLPPRRVAGLESRAVVLAIDAGKGENVLLMPERPVPDGSRVA
jgi:tRNA-binding protein